MLHHIYLAVHHSTAVGTRHTSNRHTLFRSLTCFCVTQQGDATSVQVWFAGVRRYERSKLCMIITKIQLNSYLILLLLWSGLQWCGYTYAPHYQGHASVFVCAPMPSFKCECSLNSTSFCEIQGCEQKTENIEVHNTLHTVERIHFFFSFFFISLQLPFFASHF